MTSTERDPTWSERLNPRNWSLAAKLVAVGLVPTLLALVLGVLRISDQAGAAARLGEDSRLLDLRQQIAATAQALQAERNEAVLFVTGGRPADRGPLERAVAASDARLDEVRTSSVSDPALLDASSFAALQQAQGGFTQLPVLRADVLNSPSPAAQVTDRYTAILDRAGVLERALVRQGDLTGSAGLGDALTATSEAREALELQHTVLAAAVLANRVTDQDRSVVTGTNAAFTSAFADYRIALTPTQLAQNGNFATDASSVERERLAALITAVPDNRPVGGDLVALNAAYDQAIGAVDAAATGVSTELTTTSAAAQENASNQAGINSVVLMLGVLLGIAIIVLLARSLIRSLQILRRSALEVAERRLPQAVESMRSGQPLNAIVEPVPLTGRDEVGQVARAFDAVHGQAIRLAADQAALQSNVSNMFVNLSRRSQALVERQLQLIEQLESNEQDPDQLSNLFQLDHLATRMRRNSENLLVLAGTDLAKRNVAPVPVVDVLRAAVSEIEQYQRVVVQPPPVATVAGRAASDLVHLLAELLDNATNFSPPDSQVVMSTSRASDGSLIVEIADRGVGMADHELAEANQRLSTPAAVDVSASRRMGLFVVGRLAHRHGLGIRLGTGPAGGAGGLTAAVTVPASLVPSAEPVDRRPVRAGAVVGATGTMSAVPASGAPAAYAGSGGSTTGTAAVPAQRPGNAGGRSLSALVAGDDGPMSPAPALGGGRPPVPPANGTRLPTRRPGGPEGEDRPAPPEDRPFEVPTDQQRGSWPVESLRRPPNGTPLPERRTNGTGAEAPTGPGDPAPLPKRTPRGVNGTSAEQGRAPERLGGAPGSGREGVNGTGRTNGATPSEAAALRRSTEPTAPEQEEPGAPAAGGPEQAGRPNGLADRPVSGFIAGLPRRTPGSESARGPAGGEQRDEDRPSRPPAALPRRGETPGLPTREARTADAGTPAADAPAQDLVDGSRPTGRDSAETGPAARTGTADQDSATAGSTAPGSVAGSTAPGSTAPGSTAPGSATPASAAPDPEAAPVAPAAPAPTAPDSAAAETGGTDSTDTARPVSDRPATEKPSGSPADAVEDDAASEDTKAWPVVPGTIAAAAGTAAAATAAAAFGRATGKDSPETDSPDVRQDRAAQDGHSPAPALPETAADTAESSPEQSSPARATATPDTATPAITAGTTPDSAPDTAAQDSAPATAEDTPAAGTAADGIAARQEDAAPEDVTPDGPDGPAGLPRRSPGGAPTGLGGLPRRVPGRAGTNGAPGGTEPTADGQSGNGLPSRNGVPGGLAAHSGFGDGAAAGGTNATGTNGNGSVGGTAPNGLPARPAARPEAPLGPAGLPQRRPQRPFAQSYVPPAEGLFAASTPADSSTTGQLRRPGGFESRTPSRSAPGTDTGPQVQAGAEQGAPFGSAEPTGASRPGPRPDAAPGAFDAPPAGPADPYGTPPAGFRGGPVTGPAARPAGPATPPAGAPGIPPAGPTGRGVGPMTAAGLPSRQPAPRPTPGLRPPAGPNVFGTAGPEDAAPAPFAPAPQAPAEPAPAVPASVTLPGSTGAPPEPPGRGFDLGQTTPIFEEIASAWFRSHRTVPVRWTEDEAAEPAAEEQGFGFATAADEGWRVADATAQATAAQTAGQAAAEGDTTDAGLPKRRPRARLVPGSAAGSAVLAPPSGPARNAEAIRGRLASYQQGVRQGRESRLRRQAAGGNGTGQARSTQEQDEDNR